MASRIEHIEKMLEKLSKRKEKGGREPSTIKDENNIINGVDVTRIPAKDEYAYGLRLMDILFTKTELSGALLFANSTKSDKRGLDKDRVSLLFDFIDKRYGKNTWDIKKFQAKANQKCRDTKITMDPSD